MEILNSLIIPVTCRDSRLEEETLAFVPLLRIIPLVGRALIKNLYGPPCELHSDEHRDGNSNTSEFDGGLFDFRDA